VDVRNAHPDENYQMFGGRQGVGILDPSDPGLFRVQRGRPGADVLMAPDVGMGGRYVITTGEAATVNGGIAALPNDWRRALDVQSPGFAFLVLGVALLALHSRLRFEGGVKAGAGVGS
jgi:hypothetical protein